MHSGSWQAFVLGCCHRCRWGTTLRTLWTRGLGARDDRRPEPASVCEVDQASECTCDLRAVVTHQRESFPPVDGKERPAARLSAELEVVQVAKSKQASC